MPAQGPVTSEDNWPGRAREPSRDRRRRYTTGGPRMTRLKRIVVAAALPLGQKLLIDAQIYNTALMGRLADFR